MGAITNDKTVAKSTNSLRFPANWKITIREPIERIIRKIRKMYGILCVFLFFLEKISSTVLCREREYPSNNAMMVPNITENADAAITT